MNERDELYKVIARFAYTLELPAPMSSGHAHRMIYQMEQRINNAVEAFFIEEINGKEKS